VPSKDGKRYLDYVTTAKHIRNRWAQEKQAHQWLDFGVHAQLAMAGEIVFMLEIMGHDGKISVDDARDFLLHQRFPQGWKPGSLSFPYFIAKVINLEAKFNEPEFVFKFMNKDELEKAYATQFYNAEKK